MSESMLARSSGSEPVPQIFLVFNAAIERAVADGDHRTADLLLAGKYAAVLRHQALLAEGR